MDMFGKLLAVECLCSYYIRTEIYALKRREINSVHKLVKRATFSYEWAKRYVHAISFRVSCFLTCEPYESYFHSAGSVSPFKEILSFRNCWRLKTWTRKGLFTTILRSKNMWKVSKMMMEMFLRNGKGDAREVQNIRPTELNKRLADIIPFCHSFRNTGISAY